MSLCVRTSEFSKRLYINLKRQVKITARRKIIKMFALEMTYFSSSFIFVFSQFGRVHKTAMTMIIFTRLCFPKGETNLNSICFFFFDSTKIMKSTFQNMLINAAYPRGVEIETIESEQTIIKSFQSYM